jgi:pSer/pThr/pTyr-binding forkhead associated (FHA) protein
MSTTTNTNEGSLQGRKDEIKASFELNVNGAKSTVLIRKSRIVVGSVETADVKLNGVEGVAPIHAVLELEFSSDVSQCKAMILDLASGTGVFINGRKIIHESLSAGDEVRIGGASFRFGYRKPEPRELLPDQALLLIDSGTVESIFDYRPEVKDTLEAVYSWNDAILDVDHLVKEEVLTIPPVYQNGSEIQLATKTGASWTLALTPNMKGLVYINGQSQSLESLRQSGKQVQIGSNDFAKIESGPITVYLSQTIAPPVLKKSTKLITDPFFAKTLGLSFLFSALALIGLSLLPSDLVVQDPDTQPLLPPEAKITLTKEQMKKFVMKSGQTLIKPEQPKPQETASKPAGGAQGKKEGKTGEGARKIGPEGGGKKASGDASKVASASMLKAISNPNLQTSTLLAGGGSGGTTNGRGAFDTRQNNGAYLSGPGTGGGGNSLSGAGSGLRNKGGRGDKGVGTGIGNSTGSGTAPGDIMIKPSSGGGYLVYGSINREAIEEEILKRRDEFVSCYQSEFGSGGKVGSGVVSVAFTIGKNGWLMGPAAIKASSLKNPIVERCILAVFKRIQFPEPDGGQSVSVTYPISFANSSK